MKQRLLAALIGIASLVTLLFGAMSGHSLLAPSMMPGMGKQMAPNQCQVSCTPQASLAIYNKKTIVDDKDIEPQPAEPYYIAFRSFGWPLILLLSVYLLRYLQWRPPDILKLQGAYRL